MLIETGRVVAVEDGGVWVETIRQSTCGGCAARAGCGHGMLNRFGEGRRGYVRVLTGDAGARDCAIGDAVRIGIPEKVILRGSLVVYIVPLLCLLLGAAASAALAPGSRDLLTAVGAAAGFALGLVLVRWHAWRHRRDATLQPMLVDVLRSAAAPVGKA
ncbi:MAG: SoxR reducing system RseC family protein [Halioglobus sp.]|nr:SoxR reducing system RseC family protein [Halioglobus sp.]